MADFLITFTELEVALLRGRGRQRMRKVIRMNIPAGAIYVPGQGFAHSTAALPRLTNQLLGTIRDGTVRTVEPRVQDETAVGFSRGIFDDKNVILDFDSLDVGLFASTKAIGIRAYGVLDGVQSGLTEPAEPVTLAQGSLVFEVEYTPFNGQEG